MTVEIATDARASIVFRPQGGITGLRIVTDEAQALQVTAFPFSEIGAVLARHGLDVHGNYILTGRKYAYTGESGRLSGRLPDHVNDAIKKDFAAEVFVITDRNDILDKPSVIYLQSRITAAIESAGLVTLLRGTGAATAKLSPARRATLDRMLVENWPVLFDAGCRAIHAVRPPAPVVIGMTAAGKHGMAKAGEDEAEDDGFIAIDVTTTPIGTEELELTYGSLWARGYDHDGQFVVAAGSEIRTDANKSVIARIRVRRRRLLKTPATVRIGRLRDRKRLAVAVAFPSRAIAAKTLCGAHVGSDRWRSLDKTNSVITT